MNANLLRSVLGSGVRQAAPARVGMSEVSLTLGVDHITSAGVGRRGEPYFPRPNVLHVWRPDFPADQITLADVR